MRKGPTHFLGRGILIFYNGCSHFLPQIQSWLTIISDPLTIKARATFIRLYHAASARFFFCEWSTCDFILTKRVGFPAHASPPASASVPAHAFASAFLLGSGQTCQVQIVINFMSRFRYNFAEENSTIGAEMSFILFENYFVELLLRSGTTPFRFD